MIQRVDLARWLFVLILPLFGALSCAGPFGLGGAPNVSNLEIENWQELRSPDFVLYSRGSKTDLEALALDLARYVAVVERLVQSQPPKTPARLFLVQGRAEAVFIPHPGVGGYMSHSLSGFGGFMRSSTHDPHYRHLLLHEYSHYLNLRGSKLKYPSWYKEGFAEFLGSIRTRDDVMEIGSAPRQDLLELEYRRLRKEEIDLEEIFSFAPDGKTPYPSEFYPISWAVVHYLSTNADRQKRMVTMLKHQAAGLHWKRAYDRSFSEPIERLSEKVSRHVEMMSRGTPSAVSYLPLDSLDVRDHWAIRKISPNEILRLLGDVALRGLVYLTNREGTKAEMRLAEVLFERAVELDPRDSKARAGLAAALSAQSRFDEADVQLAVFHEDPEPSAEAWVHAGDAVFRHAASLAGPKEERDSTQRDELHASAIRLYRRSLETEPKNALALAGLGYCQLATGDLVTAKESLANAATAGEWDAKLVLNQGRVERRLGNAAEARAFWQEVVWLGTAEQAKRAAALLDDIDSKK